MKVLSGICLFSFLFLFTISCSPVRRYTAANAHSHNDYLGSKPFISADEEGFGSIEADIFPVDGDLLVAHHKAEIKQPHTLKLLYLDPLLKSLNRNDHRHLNFLVDIKEDYKTSLALLVQQLQPLKQYLSTPSKRKNITISISGSRPLPSEYHLYPDFIFFDDDLKNEHTAEQWKRVSLVSLPFSKISAWKGNGEIKADDEKRIRHKIDSVHSTGKRIRFWAAPDNEASWKLQMKLKADFIGTDKISELATFIKAEKERNR